MLRHLAVKVSDERLEAGHLVEWADDPVLVGPHNADDRIFDNDVSTTTLCGRNTLWASSFISLFWNGSNGSRATNLASSWRIILGSTRGGLGRQFERLDSIDLFVSDPTQAN